ncbi:hypothetical protein A6F55_19105 [Prescottella equi]|uniref:DUF7241 domain-containing protein n=1 Tax=Rhodococcus hoagii TaxID=43767 RepID=UPI000A10C8BD|nr:hypothetical protein [Prescottella equi]ORL01802.1 hypothetical protein A6F55_19105 [Prescottella equi]
MTTRLTTTSYGDNEADVCRRLGWGPGTLLEGDEGYGPSVIRITALGESAILARRVRCNGKPVSAREGLWTLSCRDWKRVAESALDTTQGEPA